MKSGPHISEELRNPSEHRGNGVVHHDPPDNSGDDRMIYFVIGGILIAFGVGLGFLIFSMMLDWQ